MCVCVRGAGAGKGSLSRGGMEVGGPGSGAAGQEVVTAGAHVSRSDTSIAVPYHTAPHSPLPPAAPRLHYPYPHPHPTPIPTPLRPHPARTPRCPQEEARAQHAWALDVHRRCAVGRRAGERRGGRRRVPIGQVVGRQSQGQGPRSHRLGTLFAIAGRGMS